MEDRKFVFVYGLDKCLCRSSEEAINFIHKLQCRGKNLICNEVCSRKIKALFEGELFYLEKNYIDYIIYNGKRISGFSKLTTTGCGMSRIEIYPALADTLEEHQAVYLNKLEEKKQKYLKSEEERLKKRLNELNEQRRGFYAVCLYFDRCKHYKDRSKYVHQTFVKSYFSGETIAESGMDAYNKTVEHMKNSKDILPESTYPTVDSNSYWFEFLGVKTDDGYSVELWNEWKEQGLI